MQSQIDEFEKNEIIADDYQIIQLISEGSFGKVYKGKCLSKNIEVAIKVEKTEVSFLRSLEQEISILKQLDGISQVPQLYWYGELKRMNIMIISMLGKDLMHFYKKLRQFSNECISIIAAQMIEILEQIHYRNIIHRDLKPENILSSIHSQNIYLIDFGIAKNLESKKKQKEKISFIGTSRYASIAAHLGQEQTRKDDLESLGYIIIFFYKKKLPWMHIGTKVDQRIEKIGELKLETPAEQLCEGLPKSILRYMKYIRALNKFQKPNYAQLKALLLEDYKINLHQPFDWNKRPSSQNKLRSNKSIQTLKSSGVIQQKKSSFSKGQTMAPKYSFIICPLDEKDSPSFGQNQSIEKYSSQSIKVDYSQSYEQSKKQQFKRDKSTKSLFGQQFLKEEAQKLSTEQVVDDSFYDNILLDQDLCQQENQDLELKYNMLCLTSVNSNFKNPIEDFKQLYFDFQ